MMFENNWVAQQLVNQRQSLFREKAEQARQTQDAQRTNNRRHRRMIARLRTDMTHF